MGKTFRYQARSFEGELRQGTLAAENSAQVAAQLREEGFFVTKIQEQKPKPRLTLFAKDPSLQDLASLSRQLSVMINAGLPLTTSLRLCAGQVQNKLLAGGLSAVVAQVEEGQALSGSLAEHPQLFPSLFVHMVEAGESGGTLDLVLSRLATYYEREYQLEGKIRGALLYPLLISLLAVGVLAVMLFFILPQFAGIFADFEVAIPPTTQVLLAVAGFLSRFWLLILLVLLSVVLGLWAYLETPKGRYQWDHLSLKLPLLGELLGWTLTSRFARTLSTLTRGGTPILFALEISGKVVGNARFQEVIARVRSRVEQGEDLATPLEEAELLPPLVIQLMRVGEETGTLDEMLERAADFYEEEVEGKAKNFATLLEPAIIIVLGIAVALLMITTILPMYDLVSGMG